MSRAVAVKFCGLTRPQDVREASRLGADYLGFVFVPGGPRALEPEAALRMLDGIDTGKALRVGVFRDQPATLVNDIVARCGLDLVQLHGHEPRDYPAALRVPVVRAITVVAAPAVPSSGASVGTAKSSPAPIVGTAPPPSSAPHHGTPPSSAWGAGTAPPLGPNVFAALLDPQDAEGRSGGLGIAAAPGAIAAALQGLPAGARVFLSGGLTPENVAAAVRAWRPFAADVSSGIESAPGIKDARRMAAFIAALEGGA